VGSSEGAALKGCAVASAREQTSKAAVPHTRIVGCSSHGSPGLVFYFRFVLTEEAIFEELFVTLVSDPL
jgi:hypothetical protein